jgi:hypothetical protein
MLLLSSSILKMEAVCSSETLIATYQTAQKTTVRIFASVKTSYWIQFTSPHSISLWSVLILSSQLSLGHPSCPFPSGFAPKILCAFLISPMPTTSPVRHILLELIILVIFGEAARIMKLIIMKFSPASQVLTCLQFKSKHMDEHVIFTRVSSTRSPPANSGRCDVILASSRSYCIVPDILPAGFFALIYSKHVNAPDNLGGTMHAFQRLAREYVFSEQWQENVLLLPHCSIWKLSYMFLYYPHRSIWLRKCGYVRN